MRLNEWQRELEAYLLGGDPIPSPHLRASLRGGPTLSAEDGLAIYHHAYCARLLETLRGDYPALQGWLGDEQFDTLAGAYIDAHPSRHFSLRWLGAELADFIDGYLLAEQAAPLGELARLEWAFGLAFDAPPGESLTLEQMAGLPAEDWPNLQVRLLPSVQWQVCHFNSLALWRALKEQGEVPASQSLAQEQVWLIWRDGLISHYRSLDSGEARALHGMAVSGWSFAELCAQLGELGDNAPLQAASWLRQWLSDGLLRRYGL